MRFVSFISLAALIFAPIELSAQNSAAGIKTVDFTVTSTKAMPRRLNGKRPNTLKAPEGFKTDIIAGGLGQISAMARDSRGQIYVADQESGRIWVLTDRADDGRIDQKKVLPHRFDNPTGLTSYEGRLYVADKNAVWKVDGNRPPEKLAGLLATNSTGLNHPITALPQQNKIRLGLTTQDNVIKTFDIHLSTGEAVLAESLPSKTPILAFADVGGANPWILLPHAVGPTLNSLTFFSETQNWKGLSLAPKSFAPEALSPAKTANSERIGLDKNSFILSRGSPDGFDLVVLPTQLGTPSSKGHNLLSGFLSAQGRTAWGTPGPLLADNHGLLIADSFNGDVYRLTLSQAQNEPVQIAAPPKENRPPQTDTVATASAISEPSSLLSTMKGSQINAGSTLKRASEITTASTIKREDKSDEDKSKKSNAKKKQRTPLPD
jgi:hypothetical protein